MAYAPAGLEVLKGTSSTAPLASVTSALPDRIAPGASGQMMWIWLISTPAVTLNWMGSSSALPCAGAMVMSFPPRNRSSLVPPLKVSVRSSSRAGTIAAVSSIWTSLEAPRVWLM